MDFINKIMTTYPGLLERAFALSKFTQDDKEFFRDLFQNAENKTKDAILLRLQRSKNRLQTVLDILRQLIRLRDQNDGLPVPPPAPPASPSTRPPPAPPAPPAPPSPGVDPRGRAPAPGVDTRGRAPAFPPFSPAPPPPAAILVNPFVNGAIQINPPKTGPIVQMVRDETIDNINSQLDQFIQSIPTWNWAQTIKRNKNNKNKNKNKNQKTTRFIN